MTEDFIEMGSESADDVLDVSGMILDGLVTLIKYCGLRIRDMDRVTFFLNNLVEKVNADSLQLIVARKIKQNTSLTRGCLALFRGI